jgi:hypothetical protein
MRHPREARKELIDGWRTAKLCVWRALNIETAELLSAPAAVGHRAFRKSR